jgi:hypothetical protein
MILEEEIHGWSRFRDALRLDERQVFDEMLDACRLHASAASMSSRPVLMESMLISILLEQQKAIKRLRDELEHVKKRIGENK